MLAGWGTRLPGFPVFVAVVKYPPKMLLAACGCPCNMSFDLYQEWHIKHGRTSMNMVLTIFMMEMEFGNQVYMCVHAVCAERIK